MKKPFLKVALIPAVLLLVFASGCNLVESPSSASLAKDASLVLQEEFCVTFDVVMTAAENDFVVVADEFATDILAWLGANDVDLDDICSIFQSSGRIVLAEEYSGHDWDFTAMIKLKRLDIYDDYRLYLRNQTVRIPDQIAGDGYVPRFAFRGVRVVNRALTDLVEGQMPVLSAHLKLVDSDIDPEPSEMDPLIFSWDACVNVVAVVGNNGCKGN